jgi:hypothetical protein
MQPCYFRPSINYIIHAYSLCKRETQAIPTCQRKMERKILGINLKDRMQNEELRRREVE